MSGGEIATWREAAPEMLATIMRSDIGDVSYFEGRPYRTRTVDERFFEVLGIQPMIGGLTPEDFTWRPDGTADAFRPVLLSHALWQAMFAGDPAAIGKSVVASEREGRRYGFTLRGVLPEEFVYPLDLGESQPDMLVPFHTREISEDVRLYQLIVRLPDPAVAPGIETRLRGTLRRLAESPSRTSPHEIAHESQAPKALDRVDLLPLTVHLGQRDRPTFALVMSAAALLLLLACVNLAGLAAARIVERQRDLAVRRALGATTWALTRALLAEVCVLAGLATLTALAIASPLLSWTVALLPPSISTVTPPIIDVRVFVTAALIGSASAALVVIWPSLIAHRVSRIAGPMDLSRTATRLGHRSKRLIVATQTALGFVLLTAGGLAAVSLANVWRNDAGYRRDRLVLIEAFVKNYSTDADRLDQLIRAREELGRVPGVHRISATTLRMLSDRALPPSSDYVPAHWKGPFPGVDSRRVEADFFDITGLRVIEGTRPTADDWTADRPVAIVSQQAARLMWPGRSAIGQPLGWSRQRDDQPVRQWHVIAVVADARFRAMDQEVVGNVYVPGPIGTNTTGSFFLVETSGPARPVVRRLRATANRLGLFVERSMTLDDALWASVRHRVFPAWLFGSLGLAGLVVVATGVLGLLAMTAAQRTRELAIRLSLGGSRRSVVGLLAKEHALTAALGVACGSAISALTIRYLESQLYGISAYDPLVWSGGGLTLIFVGVLGTLVPATRAARIDPAITLRTE